MRIERIADGLALHGELDAATGPELDIALLETRGPVMLDLSEITFMDSGGINALLRARALLGREDRTLALVRPSAPVRRTLETARHRRPVRTQPAANVPAPCPWRSVSPTPTGAFNAVRLASDLPLSHEQRSFTRNGDGWRLDVDVSDILRLEYKLEVEHVDGATEHVCDPGNPKRAPGAFGEKSVLELPGYEPPAWLDEEGVEGEYAEVAIRGRGLGAHVPIRIWSPASAAPGQPLRLLLANDGPEYDELSQLTRFAAAKIAAGSCRRSGSRCSQPLDRNQWYSASAAYSRVLAHDIVPALRELRRDRRAGGRWARASAGWRCCTPSAASRARSARCSCSRAASSCPATTPTSAASRATSRIIRFVRETLRDGQYAIPVPTTITVGTRGGERPQQSRDGACPCGSGVRGVPGGGSGPA